MAAAGFIAHKPTQPVIRRISVKYEWQNLQISP
jgi:hypothetical protein